MFEGVKRTIVADKLVFLSLSLFLPIHLLSLIIPPHIHFLPPSPHIIHYFLMCTFRPPCPLTQAAMASVQVQESESESVLQLV